MAQRAHITLVDDIDGSEATETVLFGLDGIEYAIDLNPDHAADLRDILGTHVEHGRRTGGRKKRSDADATPLRAAQATLREKRASNDRIREWGRANGYDISARGRIASHIVAAYRDRDKTSGSNNSGSAKAPAKRAARKPRRVAAKGA